ncbi:MAG: ferrous iron transport protein A [Saprospiraceae bacterium]|nr:ferrous iron transport protein A [Saprospiraceae bacterium]
MRITGIGRSLHQPYFSAMTGTSPSAINLNELAVGSSATLINMKTSSTGIRLLSMGVKPGCTLKVLRKAPMGGALYVSIDHMVVALRRSEAALIKVTP